MAKAGEKDIKLAKFAADSLTKLLTFANVFAIKGMLNAHIRLAE